MDPEGGAARPDPNLEEEERGGGEELSPPFLLPPVHEVSPATGQRGKQELEFRKTRSRSADADCRRRATVERRRRRKLE